MTSLGYPSAHFIWVLTTIFCALIGLLAGFAAARRAIHTASRYSRQELAGWIEQTLSGSADYDTGLHTLRQHSRCARRALLERLPLTDSSADPDRVATLKRLCTDLGLVALWRRQLTGRPSRWTLSRLFQRGLTPLERLPGLNFVARAEAGENLGIVRDHASRPLLIEALDDPHLAVRSVAARALSRIQGPESFRALARKLESAALGRGRILSVRSLKMALASFPVSHAAEVADMLRYPHWRVRFLAANVIATMVQRTGNQSPPHEPLAQEIAETFLGRLFIDTNPDVRARAADVIGSLRDSRALPALLILLEDAAWFVRLHAARALAHRLPVPREALRRHLTDANWRVREAATQALAAPGQPDVRPLLTHFLTTEDRYSREQVAEQIERMGLIPSLLAAFGESGAENETRFIAGMVRMGRTAALSTALNDGLSYKRPAVLDELRWLDDDRTRAFIAEVLRMPPPSDLPGMAALADSVAAPEPGGRGQTCTP